jgi:hypothetical protein
MVVLLRAILAWISTNGLTTIFILELAYSFFGYFKDLFAEIIIPASIKLSAASAYVVLVYGLIMGYLQSIALMTDLLVLAMPAPIVGAWGWVMPPHTIMCLTFLFTAYSVRYFFDWYIYFLESRYKAVLSLTGD